MMTEFEISKYGNSLIHKKAFTPEVIERIILDNALSGLFIHDVWDPVENLDFLSECTFLEGLALTPRYDHSFEFLKHLTKLKYLSIQGGGKKGIDFPSLLILERLTLNWRKKITGLDRLVALQEVCFTEYAEPNLLPISVVPTITTVRLKGSSIRSLEGIQNLHSLKKAYFGSCRSLHSIKELHDARHLEELSFWSCPKIEAFDVLGHLPALKKLEIVDCKEIPSIQFIAEFPQLEYLSLVGTTKVMDGNMEPTTHIKRVLGADRRQYSPLIKRTWEGYL